jgi:hypothetical protein
MELAEKIRVMQQELILLAEKKGCVIQDDPDIYEKSCLIDKMIVELMKPKSTKI